MEDLTFYVEENGENIKCDIISMIPGDNDNETYIAFTDYKKDGNDYCVKYAKIIRSGEEYSIEEFDDDVILEELMSKMNEDIIKFVNENMENGNE